MLISSSIKISCILHILCSQRCQAKVSKRVDTAVRFAIDDKQLIKRM